MCSVPDAHAALGLSLVTRAGATVVACPVPTQFPTPPGPSRCRPGPSRA